MADVHQALETLRATIAGIISNLETWDTLKNVCDVLGFPAEDPQGHAKANYLRKLVKTANDRTVISAAKQMLNSYPGIRGKPSGSDTQNIQDALWWIESEGIQRISNVTRYRIAENLEDIRFWGRLSIGDLLAPILQDGRDMRAVAVGSDGHLYEDTSEELFIALVSGSPPRRRPPVRISALNYLKKLGLTEWPDERFCLLIERIIAPEVQPTKTQQELVMRINTILQQDAFELRPEGLRGGVPVYKIRRIGAGVVGSPKYIIFASTGPKPDIVVDDAVNMDIRVVQYADKCLIYDQPPPHDDLTWQMLVEWWGKKMSADVPDVDIRRDLGQRLTASLQSEPERILFNTYFRIFNPKLGVNLPALLPQVYLHYDPRNQGEREKRVLVRQRMDFLMLLRNAVRIVIEIDGKQHYSDDVGQAKPSLYAEMVAEDRRIRLLSYEIYRFGGAEFTNQENAAKVVSAFFDDLFDRHGIHSEP